MMEPLCGVFNIYKEPGWTSFDVVAKMRGICRIRKVGHTGTLDPAAEGVLPVCVGKATRIAELLSGESKTYRADLLLGRETDTLDQTGNVIREADPELVAGIREADVRTAIESFAEEGGYEQLPPMYSARHHEGKRLYELARQGQEVERKPSFVRIHSITADRICPPLVTITVTCGKGTYIRSLCADIGEKLGCGAVMTHLVRTRVGAFRAEEALTIEQISRMAGAREEDPEQRQMRLKKLMIPVDHVFPDYPTAAVSPEFEKAAVNGNRIPIGGIRFFGTSGEGSDSRRLISGSRFRLYTPALKFIGIFRYDSDLRTIRPVKIF